MTLGAYDIQTSGGAYLLRLGVCLCLVFFVILLILLSCLCDNGIVCLGKARGLGYGTVVIAVLAQLSLSHVLGVASEHDIRASACHVGSYGDRSELTCLSDYLSLFLMVLGVEHVMLDAALFEQL